MYIVVVVIGILIREENFVGGGIVGREYIEEVGDRGIGRDRIG